MEERRSRIKETSGTLKGKGVNIHVVYLLQVLTESEVAAFRLYRATDAATQRAALADLLRSLRGMRKHVHRKLGWPFQPKEVEEWKHGASKNLPPTDSPS